MRSIQITPFFMFVHTEWKCDQEQDVPCSQLLPSWLSLGPGGDHVTRAQVKPQRDIASNRRWRGLAPAGADL